MSTIMQFHFGNATTVHYYNPGKNLSDLDLMEMHEQLLKVNAKPKVVHPLLCPNTKINKLRTLFASIVVTLIRVHDDTIGFMVSPVLRQGNVKVGHAGLVVIGTNPGRDLLTLAGLGTMYFSYLKEGKMYATNISSTPAIIESFTRLVSNTWPSPKAALVCPKKEYRTALQVLFDEYIAKNFLHPESLKLDYKRFVLQSSSQEMGFNTDFRALSRSANFNFLSFCFVWIDYEKQEDIVQVGMLDFRTFVKIGALLLFYKLKSLRYRKNFDFQVPMHVPAAKEQKSA